MDEHESDVAEDDGYLLGLVYGASTHLTSLAVSFPASTGYVHTSAVHTGTECLSERFCDMTEDHWTGRTRKRRRVHSTYGVFKPDWLE